MQVVEIQDVKARIAQVVSSGMVSVRLKVLIWIAVPGAGRSLYNKELIKQAGSKVTRIKTVTNRPRRQSDNGLDDYRFVEKEVFGKFRIIGGTEYSLDNNDYAITVEDVVEAFESGTDVCLVNTTVQGMEVLSKILRDLHVAVRVDYFEVTEHQLHHQLHKKFDKEKYGPAAIASRFKFGQEELKKLEILKKEFVDFHKKPTGLKAKPLINAIHSAVTVSHSREQIVRNILDEVFVSDEEAA